MSADEELEEIRRQKRDELVEQLDGDGGADAGEATPSVPVEVESPAHFEELTTTHDVVLVDFYADWCGPCRMMEPAVEAVAAETDAAVAKVDVDAHQALATRHGVRGVPTLVVYADGEPAEQVTGAHDEATLRRLVETQLA